MNLRNLVGFGFVEPSTQGECPVLADSGLTQCNMSAHGRRLADRPSSDLTLNGNPNWDSSDNAMTVQVHFTKLRVTVVKL